MHPDAAAIADVRALLAGIGARLPPEPLRVPLRAPLLEPTRETTLEPTLERGREQLGERCGAPAAAAAAGSAALAASVDLTLLRPDATAQQIRALCDSAVAYGCCSVCVNPIWVELAVSCVAGRISVCSVAGFPLGATTTDGKRDEAARAISAGAAEVDMVSAIGWLVEGLPRGDAPPVAESLLAFQEQVAAVGRAVRVAVGPVPAQRRALKVILETCLLDTRQKLAGALLAAGARADFVKTSTGFSSGGATVADVTLLRAALGGAAHAAAGTATTGIKASGGIREAAAARALLAAGATRLGCSSLEVFAAD